MGCGSSTDTVQPLTADGVNGDEDDRGSKLRGCGDSAVSKGTTDSGVVMEKEIPMLPGAVPRKLPPLSSEWVREIHPDFLQQESTAQERQKSSEILEELLNQGIIPVGQTKEKSSGAGEAYSIMLNDTEVVRRRPPARLESLKAKKEQMLTSREDIEEKIRLAEERRKLREDELKMRLRAKSARVRVRVRAPISRTEEDEDSPVEPLESALSSDLLQNASIAAEVEDFMREAGGDGKENKKEISKAGETEDTEKVGVSGNDRGEGAEKISENSSGEEEERLNEAELESDSNFQHTEEETF
ncbi:stathmin domain-containing protein 1 [Anabas testudineus]|uniref:stathmin domain-containing protein 1 n=1 Tax=Anabas testudineus TaxID=64144 RepID=UPI000E456D59|nr:stathmin domain-containing protein 1 [Anabas testudineus]